MTEGKNGEADHAKTYAIVGELVLIASALDYQLAEIMVEVLNMGPSPMIMPVVLTLDAARKVEILKRRAGLITSDDWKKGLIRHVEKVERVFKQRNIACHMPPMLQDGKWTLRPLAAAKLFRSIDLDKKTLEGFKVGDLAEAIALGEVALGEGAKVLENCQRANAELEKRSQPSAGK
jgi:hypothetical protein